MKIHIWTNGDPSVGISGQNATVDIETMEDSGINEPGERDIIRNKLKEAFSAIFDEKAHVAFEDELDVPDLDDHDRQCMDVRY